MDNRVTYFSQMFQAVPHLAQVHAALPGIFVSGRQSTLTAVRRLYPQMPTAREMRWLGPFSAGRRCLKGADVIVTGSPYQSLLAPYHARKCMVFHGTYMLLSKSALEANAHYDLLCVIGPRMQQAMARYADEIAVNAVPTGFLPFCEFPEQSPAQRRQVLLDLGLDPDCRTVVYTPSRRGVGSWNVLAESLLEQAPPEMNLVLRPHPSQALTPRAKDRDSFRRVQTLAARRPGSLVDFTSRPLSAILSVADLVVSDANSPAEESLFYDVPQLFVETSQYSRDVLRQMAVRERMHVDDTEQLLTLYGCGPSVFVDGPVAVAPMIETALADAGRYAERRQRYFSWVFGSRDRLAGQRVAKAIQTNLMN